MPGAAANMSCQVVASISASEHGFEGDLAAGGVVFSEPCKAEGYGGVVARVSF